MPEAKKPPQLPVGPPDLVFVCRMCTKLAEQLSQGADRCRLKCGGPKKGMAFPMYAGPLTDRWLESQPDPLTG